jgi:tRNA pseudouridine38-40 synthase
MSTTRNIRLVIGYDGSDYCGWQRQNNGRSIQGDIETLLARMCREEVNLHGAGRTDAGVHADGMVAHFHTEARISPANFRRGLNAMLPGAIRVFAVDNVDASFHARFSAIGKEYRYEIFHGPIQPPRLCRYSLHVPGILDLERIRSCLRLLQGTHDFSSFENAGTRDKSKTTGRGAVRTIHAARLLSDGGNGLTLHFHGDGFLRNMIRNMVGTLLEAGRGKLSPQEFAAILAARDRTAAGPTAPAHGLCLTKVLY